MLCRIDPSFCCSRVAEATLNHPLFVFVALVENSKEERQKKRGKNNKNREKQSANFFSCYSPVSL